MPLFFITVNIDPSLASHVGTPSWDTFILLAAALAIILYSFFVNRERLGVVLLSNYAALAISQGTPFLKNILPTLSPFDAMRLDIGVFVGLFIILYLLLSHNLSLRSEFGHSWLHAFVLSIVQVGLLVSSILVLIPPSLYKSNLIDYFFIGDLARSIWILAPLVALLLMRRRSDGMGVRS